MVVKNERTEKLCPPMQLRDVRTVRTAEGGAQGGSQVGPSNLGIRQRSRPEATLVHGAASPKIGHFLPGEYQF